MRNFIRVVSLLAAAYAASFSQTLLVNVSTDRTEYYLHQTIRVSVTGTNMSDTSVTLHFSSACQFNVCVVDEWCWSDNHACATVLTDITLPPHASITFSDTTSRLFSVGEHTVVGWIGNADSAGNYGKDTTTFNVLPLPTGLTYIILTGWNLISLPLEVEDNRISTLFPTAVSKAFYWDGHYRATDRLEHGKGYWLKFSSSDPITVSGTPILNDTINLLDRWNIFGSIAVPLDVRNIILEPPDIHIFGPFCGPWNEPCRTIVPGAAYWIKSSGAGKAILKAF